MSRHLKKIVSFLCFSLLAVDIAAQTPTQQQIEQFKRLPKAQQEQIARQFGFDVSVLEAGTQQADPFSQNNNQSGVYERGTRFDEFGNPILDPEQDNEEDTGAKEELELYGLSLFANEPMSFTPVMDLPVPANYLLGPGDELKVQLFGKENENYDLTVNREGQVNIPKLGPLQVSSMSFAEAKLFIAEKVKQQIIGVDVSVSMGKLRTMRIFVMGEAYRPGAYNISSLSTITQALFASGGVTDIASLRNIQLKRSGKLVTTLDLYDLLNAGDSSNDAQLQAGDVVFIPALERSVTVDGQVRRPAIYELKDEATLEQVIKLAGGKLPDSFDAAISIQRFVNGTQIQLTADLTKETTEVQNGDIVTLPKISSYVSNSVSLIGAVARPGKYEWKQGLTLRDIVTDQKRDFLEVADLSYVLILREVNQNGDIVVHQADLTQRNDNPELAPHDKVLVFSRNESEHLGDFGIEDLAFNTEELEQREKDAWQLRIEEKLFWKSVGLGTGAEDDDADTDDSVLADQPIIELTEEEKLRVLEFKNTTYFSRKRMLSPVIAMLREQAKFGEPIQLVEVAGAVKVPGIYPLTQNAGLKELLKAAGGLTESSYSNKSEITRTEIDTNGVAKVNHITFSPFKVLNGTGDKLLLKSKDRVNIFTTPAWQEELKVTIKGEVEFPGEYTISRGEKLSDLIARAGGLTDYGNPDSIIFTRESLKEQERANLKRLTEELRKQIASESLRSQKGAGGIVSYDEARKLLRDLTRATPVGRLVVDFNKLFAGDTDTDVILENGDTLYIPGLSQSVNVIGEVYVPTSHLYARGLSYTDYINRSGGFRALADESSTYIIRANGSVDIPKRGDGFWFNSDSEDIGSIRPGDTIVVPFDSDNVDNMTLWANATQIIYQLAVAVAAIGSL